MAMKKLLVLAAISMTVMGCSDGEDEAALSAANGTERPLVYTSNYPLEYFVERIAAPVVEARFLVPGDEDPAHWTPNAEDVLAMQQAALILPNTTARYRKAPDYPIGIDAGGVKTMIATVSDTWGSEEQVSHLIPSRSEDPRFRARLARLQRLTLSPAEAATHIRAMVDVDVRSILASIRIPTLILHRRGFAVIPVSHAQYLADHIEEARLVEVPGQDGPFVWEHPEVALDAIEEFLTGVAPEAGPNRVIATVLFTDILRSTLRAAELGDPTRRAPPLVPAQLRATGGGDHPAIRRLGEHGRVEPAARSRGPEHDEECNELGGSER